MYDMLRTVPPFATVHTYCASGYGLRLTPISFPEAAFFLVSTKPEASSGNEVGETLIFLMQYFCVVYDCGKIGS